MADRQRPTRPLLAVARAPDVMGSDAGRTFGGGALGRDPRSLASGAVAGASCDPDPVLPSGNPPSSRGQVTGRRRRGATVNEALVLLVLVWAALLVPSALRSRNVSPHATVGGFERAMDVLRSETRGTRAGREVLVPGDPGRIVQRPVDVVERPVRPGHEDPVVARRRSWFVRSVIATGVMFVMWLAIGGWLWLPLLASAGLTGGYAAVLRHLKLQRDAARRVVRELDLHRPSAATPDKVAVVGGSSWGGSGTVRLRRWDD